MLLLARQATPHERGASGGGMTLIMAGQVSAAHLQGSAIQSSKYYMEKQSRGEPSERETQY